MKIIFLFLLIFSSAWARVDLELKINSDKVKQGQITPAVIVVRDSSGQTAFSGLQGKSLGKTIYLYKVSPFMGKDGILQSEAKIIFSKVPESNSVTEVINGEEVVLTWSNIEIEPTEAAKSFLFADFEIPDRLVILPWLYVLFLLVVISFLVMWINRKIKTKKLFKSKKRDLKNELLGARSYEEIVLVWREKTKYLQMFPAIEEEFKKFEQILFKHQFKPQRTEKEVEEVSLAYQSFRSKAGEVLSGI